MLQYSGNRQEKKKEKEVYQKKREKSKRKKEKVASATLLGKPWQVVVVGNNKQNLRMVGLLACEQARKKFYKKKCKETRLTVCFLSQFALHQQICFEVLCNRSKGFHEISELISSTPINMELQSMVTSGNKLYKSSIVIRFGFNWLLDQSSSWAPCSWAS